MNVTRLSTSDRDYIGKSGGCFRYIRTNTLIQGIDTIIGQKKAEEESSGDVIGQHTSRGESNVILGKNFLWKRRVCDVVHLCTDGRIDVKIAKSRQRDLDGLEEVIFKVVEQGKVGLARGQIKRSRIDDTTMGRDDKIAVIGNIRVGRKVSKVRHGGIGSAKVKVILVRDDALHVASRL